MAWYFHTCVIICTLVHIHVNISVCMEINENMRTDLHTNTYILKYMYIYIHVYIRMHTSICTLCDVGHLCECNTLEHTERHCDTLCLQHIATHVCACSIVCHLFDCNTLRLQQSASANTNQHIYTLGVMSVITTAATHCNTHQPTATATHCKNTHMHLVKSIVSMIATRCNTLQHTITDHTATGHIWACGEVYHHDSCMHVRDISQFVSVTLLLRTCAKISFLCLTQSYV